MRIGARKRFATLFFVAMVALQLAAALSRGTATFWAREAGSAVEWGVGASPMVAACLAGYSCYAARSIVPATTSTEALALVRGWRLCAFAAGPGLAAAALSTSVSVLVLLGIVGGTRGNLTYPHTLALLLVVLCMYVGFALFGAAVGALLQGIAIPFLLALGGILAFFLARSVHGERLLRIGGSTGSLSDFHLIPSVVATWCAAFLALALPPLVIVWHKQRSFRSLSSVPAAALALVATVCMFALLASGSGGGGFAYAIIRTFPSACAGQNGLSVCVRRDSTFDARATAAAFSRYARVVDSLPDRGPVIRKWGVVSVPYSAPPPGAAYIVANSAGQPVPLAYEMAQGSVAGAGCPAQEANEKYTSTLTVAGEWVMLAATGHASPGVTSRQLAWLRDPASREWVAKARTALRGCDLDRVVAPPGWSTKETGLTW